MSKTAFTDGGFVLHKIAGDFKGTASAWYNSKGWLLSAEIIRPDGQSRPVRWQGPIWQRLTILGKVWEGDSQRDA